jgi:transcriptional regulator with XRE-family HTH domain
VPSSRVPGDRALRNLGRRVAELRISRGFTQEDLAERLDKDRRYVQEIEGGRQNITIRTAALVAQKLRVQVSELFLPPTTRETSGLRRVPTRKVRKK